MKKVLKLEGHDPIEIYGPGNKILEEFCTYFPGLKVVARGDEILLDGSRDDLAAFQQKFSELIRLRHVKPSLTRFDIESLFDAESSAEPFPGFSRLEASSRIFARSASFMAERSVTTGSANSRFLQDFSISFMVLAAFGAQLPFSIIPTLRPQKPRSSR